MTKCSHLFPQFPFMLVMFFAAIGILVCGCDSSKSSDNTPVPDISSTSPSSADSGGTAFTLTVNGLNFVSGSTVVWNGSSRTTTYVSDIKLTSQILASDIATERTVQITVSNPSGKMSASFPFYVSPPAIPDIEP